MHSGKITLPVVFFYMLGVGGLTILVYQVITNTYSYNHSLVRQLIHRKVSLEQLQSIGLSAGQLATQTSLEKRGYRAVSHVHNLRQNEHHDERGERLILGGSSRQTLGRQLLQPPRAERPGNAERGEDEMYRSKYTRAIVTAWMETNEDVKLPDEEIADDGDNYNVDVENDKDVDTETPVKAFTADPSQTEAKSKAKTPDSRLRQQSIFTSDSIAQSAEDVPRQRYVMRSFIGRLGNVLFELAAALCVALQNNMTLLVQRDPHLDFLNLTRIQHVHVVQRLDKLTHEPRQVHSSPGCKYVSSLTRLDASRHHSLQGYFQSWRYFEPCKGQILAATAFSDSVTAAASVGLRQLRYQFPGATLVGVHVRMEDIADRLRTQGRTVADKDYYLKAMTYFRKRHNDVKFLVIASDHDWFRRQITAAADVVMLTRSSSAAVDMELLSRMDNIIISVGTFGWWAAYKSHGTVICFRDFFLPNSPFSRQFEKCTNDFFYPGWILM